MKDEIAKVRGKEKYELGDFAMALDEISKSMTEELTGKSMAMSGFVDCSC